MRFREERTQLFESNLLATPNLQSIKRENTQREDTQRENSHRENTQREKIHRENTQRETTQREYDHTDHKENMLNFSENPQKNKETPLYIRSTQSQSNKIQNHTEADATGMCRSSLFSYISVVFAPCYW